MWTGRRASSSSGNTMSAAQQTTTTTSSSDIRKMGYLKKLKTNKKKLFLLREESEAGPARLEYYDSEKKYKAGGPAKRWIPLQTCFNINKKSDAKHKYAIALYTKEDCFSVVCETETEQEEWLTVLLELQNDNVNEGEEPRPFFEHIWQVTVKPRGLGNGKNLTAGPYRLCLTNKTLSLVRLSQHDPDIIFQLASLRRCGHSDCFFFMEAGSSAVTGAGELWMQVEDTVIARNIHETILRNMAGDQAFRPRSRSSVSDRRSTKPISVPSNSRGASPGYDSSTLPVRSKTISGDHPSSPTAPSRLRPGKGSSSGRSSTTSSLGRGHSPVPTSPLGHTLSEAHRSRTDSMESRGSHGTVSSLSADELDLSPHDHHSSTASTRSVTPEGASIRDDPSYLSMTPLGSKDILVSPTSEMGAQNDPYMEMTSGSRDSYMDMSPGETTYLEMARTSFSSSPAVSTTSSGLDSEDHCYLDMAPIAHSLPTVQERITDAGYLDMSPGNSWLKGPMPRPDRVHSYLSDDQASTEDFPKRAYSVGSKPTSIKNRGDNTSSYVDMTGKDGNLDKANPKSSSAPHLVDKDKGGHVTPDMARVAKEMMGRATIYNKELLMEFDFLGREGDNSAFRPRTSSAGREFRQRTSSIGQEMRRRAGSFGKEGVNRTSSIGRHDRPRTTTICQESFRNRTSSFGSTDMRPRSSSHGSRSYYKGKVAEKAPSETDSRGSSRHSSQESLRRTLQKAAEEYANKGGSQESYMDMLMRRTPSPSVPPNSTPTTRSVPPNSTPTTRGNNDKSTATKMNSLYQGDEYLAMTPGGSVEGGAVGGASYMDMNYETQERHKDQRRRTNTDTPTKSTDPKTAKSSRPRSSMKSQQHHRGLYLRMPSAEAKQSDTKDEAKADRPPAKSPGEYIDIGFSAKSSAKPKSIALGKQKSYDSADSKAVWSPQTDAYAVFAPGAPPAPSVGAGLDPVVCPLRLDEEDDTPNASPNAIQPGTHVSLPTTPRSTTSTAGSADYMVMPGQKDDYMEMPGHNLSQDQLTPDTATPGVSAITSDPFSLLGPMSLDSAVKQDTNRSHHPTASRSLSIDSTGSSSMSGSKHTDLPAASTSRNRLGSKGRNSSNRKSPVLPPKVKSKAKSGSTSSMNKEVGKPTKVVQTLSMVSTTVTSSMATTARGGTSGGILTRSLSTGHEGGSKPIQAASNTPEPVTLDPPFAELVPPTPIGVQKLDDVDTLHSQPSTLSSSTKSLNSIEGGLSSSNSKAQITSRGSTSSLSSMDSTRVITTMSGAGRLSQGLVTTRSDHLTPTMATTSVVSTSVVSTSVAPGGGCEYENLAVGGRASHHSSRNSIGSDKELNYASLDLASSQDETTFPAISERSPRSPLIGKTTPKSPVTEEEEVDSTPLSYAEIDFTKSEELRAATSLRERMPFDVK